MGLGCVIKLAAVFRCDEVVGFIHGSANICLLGTYIDIGKYMAASSDL